MSTSDWNTTYTLETLIELKGHLGDVPSRFQYPVAYVSYIKTTTSTETK